ncbi:MULTISPECIES: hypothetical protein [unclassified Colwellia]|uniref:hypothetical protein n=1 Tax=unclassified Colwellia TaxID=196834 RepID=UPI0015F62184|nr:MULTISPECIES: hypothetical protein [unclassified Colwellia]MBA6365652.1 hypothetical protein [Colwellia sp. BRX8-8]MBA6352985.1 hypothetical protein [Colwellia sp. BRX9-1]MBA6357219.1 hypothetical protein [Colwellia sp. BRX8-3]MBA6359259.1 hypothetical protein [Colwellia sp. BRX8-6]MBA6368090.1 hypothetical protein [Colwellia sp. BRX8-5]
MVSILGFNIIDEGVETEQQGQPCKQLNIGRVQGCYYSRPKPQHDIEITYLQTLDFFVKGTQKYMQ